MGIIIIVIIAFIIIKFIGLMLTGVAGVVGTSYAVGKTINERNLQQRINDFFSSNVPDEDYVNLGDNLSKKIVVRELDTIQETEKANITINKIILRNVKAISNSNVYFEFIDDSKIFLESNKIYSVFSIDLIIENKSNEIINLDPKQALAVNNLQQQSLTSMDTNNYSKSIMPNARINVVYQYIFNSAGEDIKEIKIFIPTINEYITINLEELKTK